ncbi:equilibrative nucleobase transporter 1-like isoform X2 [Leucoraja erinacea]|uniref:equilibrative nucleobase transporter 1-like isoform X2 n=1 Tax=Leucoraja erinaceus TaxID=7782 RepID=UPI0024576D52|nr:equilibrative nucleobase transporter 1-like isoform X2 [Leucoraja erinacea]
MERLGERVKRYLTLATGVIECFGFAGVIIGWPSLVFVLKTKEYFADLCLPVHNSSDSAAANATDCHMQDERFTLIFTIASFVMPVATIANGFLFDYGGTMATRLLAIFLYTTGNLMVAFSTNASAALLFPAISLLGVGGLFLFITNMQVGNLFGSKRSTIITVYNGAFDSSAVVFLIIKVLNEAGFSVLSIFVFISCLSAFLILRTIFLLPRTHFPYPLPEGYRVNCENFGLLAHARKVVTAKRRISPEGAESSEGKGGETTGDSDIATGDGRETNGDDEESRESQGGFEEGRRDIKAKMGWGGMETNNEQAGAEEDTGQCTTEEECGGGGRSEEMEMVEEQDGTDEELRKRIGERCGNRRTRRVKRKVTTRNGCGLPADNGNLRPNDADGAAGKEKENVPSFRTCVLSRLFLTHLLWFSLIQLRLILYIGTVNPMLNFLSNNDPIQVSRFTNALGITQLCGILCAPFNGLILDRHKRRCQRLDSIPEGSTSSERLADMHSAVLSLAITVTLSVLFSVSAAIPVLEVQYLTFVLQMVNRAFLYGGFSAFLVMAFPLCHFGKLFGTMQTLAAIVSVLQYPCFILVSGPLQGNPLYLNIALIAIVIWTFAHPINVYFYCRREKAKGTDEATTDRNAERELSM